MEHTIVYKDAGAYSCFPDILLRRNGELLVTFRRAGGFSLEALRRGKYDHVDKDARIALARSSDGGRSWQLDRIFEPFDPNAASRTRRLPNWTALWRSTFSGGAWCLLRRRIDWATQPGSNTMVLGRMWKARG